MNAITKDITKAAIASEFGLNVPDVTRKLQELKLPPYDSHILAEVQVMALRRVFGGQQPGNDKASFVSDFSGNNLGLASSQVKGDRKSPEELRKQWGLSTAKTVLRYAASADTAWRPKVPIQPGTDGKFDPEQVALIEDAKVGVGRFGTHDEYIRRRAAWLEEKLAKNPAPAEISQPSDRSNDESDIAAHFSTITSNIAEQFSNALDRGLEPLVQQAQYELSPDALNRRFVGLLVDELSKKDPPKEPGFLGNLFSAAGRVRKRFAPDQIAGLLSNE